MFLSSLKCLFDDLSQVGFLLLLDGVFHLILEVVPRLSIYEDVWLFALEEVVAIDIFVHLGDVVLKVEDEFVKLFAEVEKHLLPVNFSVDQYVFDLNLSVL